MSVTTVDKYAGTTTNKDWSSFTVAHLNTDDADYASVSTSAWDAAWGYPTNFGFAIPDDAVITEVKVTYEAYASGADTYMYVSPDYLSAGLLQRLSTSGATVYTKTWTTSLPTVAQLNSSTYRITFFTQNTVRSTTTYVDYIKLTVKYYTSATLTTAAISAITQETATGGGNATSAGSGTISEKGVCWNYSGSPTIADSHTSDGSGTGAFVSSLTGLFPSSHYYVRAYATTEDGTGYGPVEEFDTLASSSRSLVARPFTTRAAAAELVARQGDGIIDWWIEDDVLRAELRPTDVAQIPRDRWYVVSRGTPGVTVSLTMDSEDTPDVICAIYRTYGVTDVRDGSIRRVYYPVAPTTPTQRVDMLDITGQYMSTAEATTYAANVWTRVNADAMSASITAKGGLYTVDGAFTPAPLIAAGDWIDVTDRPGRQPGDMPVFITGTSYSKAEHLVTITTGSREQNELVVPGLSSLPGELSVYGADTAYGDSGGDTTTTGGTGMTDPGVVDPVPYKKIVISGGTASAIRPPQTKTADTGGFATSGGDYDY